VGGGMMFNEGVIQSDALPILEEMDIGFKDKGGGYYTMDTVEATSTLISRCVQKGTSIFNLIKATDVLFREDKGKRKGYSGLVLNWSPVEHLAFL